MSKPLGEFVKFSDLNTTEQKLVRMAWDGAASSADNKLCFQSDFPVGAAILAATDTGKTKMFGGCNVENDYFPATICAERNAATTAAWAGYKHFRMVAVLCRKYPGGSPCGLCRQVLNQFGCDAVLLNVCDKDSNVRRATVGDLLPAATGNLLAFADLTADERKLVNRVVKVKDRSHVPYSKRPRGAVFVAANGNGHTRVFDGVSDDNASYGGSALAESVAMRSARTAGYSINVALIVSVEDVTAHNPLDGESLQILREFGADAPVWLVGPNKEVVRTTLEQLLPDSFGPEAL